MDGQTGFVWKLDRSYFIGVCPHYKADDQTVTMGGASRVFDGINVTRDTDQLILYTPQYNDNTLTDASAVSLNCLSQLATGVPRPPEPGESSPE